MDSPQALNRPGIPWDRPFALVDCSSFYASCEKLLVPALRDHPIIVLSNNDGCVVSRCPQAKVLGIPLGAPYFKIKPLADRHEIAVFSSNYELYADISQRVMTCLRSLSPRMEVYSIDEAFLKPEETGPSLRDWALGLRRRVKRTTGIDVTVGTGPSKTLAKVASRLAKTSPGGEGVFCLESAVETRTVLEKLPVSELWGIGYRYQKKLQDLGILLASQLLDQGEIWLDRHLGGVIGRRLWWELHGLPCRTLNPLPPQREQIAYARSFSRPIEEERELADAISQYISGAAARMRSFNLAARRMTVFLHTNRHRPRLPQYHPALQHRFMQAVFYTPELIETGKRLLGMMFRPGHRYIKAGIILWELCLQSDIPPPLFAPPPNRHRALMASVDEINRLMGRNTVRPASFVCTADWQMRRGRLSPRYTTRWGELPVISRCLLRETGEPLSGERQRPPDAY
jgi:DNA polymerase V